MIRRNGLSIDMMLAFLSFRQTFTDRANALISQVVQFKLIGLHLQRLSDIAGATPDSPAQLDEDLVVKGGIAVRDLWFRYGDTDPFIFSGLNLDIAPGEFVAITGQSGRGKTTLLKILLGLRTPTNGEVYLDGKRISTSLWRSWRRHVGVVAQDDQLLAGTIAENIAFYDPDLDMDVVRRVATDAQLDADIIAMPMQYMSLVGDMGSSLSGGQRQRVLLARSLYRQPKILVLDEGTANLDEATEQSIADLVSSLQITRIVVAHRPALIERANRVIRLD